MSEPNGKCIGYLKYYGESVESGCLDARKSADALAGFDEALRYLIYKEDPTLRAIEFEFPVKIEKGSWGIFIPENIEALITLAGGATLLTAYFGTLAVKAANDGVLETGPAKNIKKTVKGAITAFRWLAEIAKHCGKLGQSGHKNVTFSDHKTVQIQRKDGSPLEVPYQYFELYTKAPSSLLDKVSSVIEQGRELEIGVVETAGIVRTQISVSEKAIFCKEKEPDSDETVLPELVHDEHVSLEGVVTRCNEKLNDVGFEYRGHTLTCKPVGGHVVEFKKKFISQNDDHVYAPVRMEGRVDRKDIHGEFKEKFPRIFFSSITPLETKNEHPDLFNHGKS